MVNEHQNKLMIYKKSEGMISDKQNIARGTTDPGYRVYNFHFLLKSIWYNLN